MITDALAFLHLMWQQMLRGDVQGILFGIALYCALVGVGSLWFQLRVRRWPSVRGVLASAGLERWGGPSWAMADQEYGLHSAYRYQVDGQLYEGHRVSPWVVVASHNARFVLAAQLKGVERHPNGTVSVFYNPNRAHKSYLVRPGRLGLLVTFFIIAAPTLYYLHRFHDLGTLCITLFAL